MPAAPPACPSPRPSGWRARRRADGGTRVGSHGDDYRTTWMELFRATYAKALIPEARVLDVGSGRRPTIPPESRPASVRYVGLDVSAVELAAAPDGSYDEIHVTNVETFLPELEHRFDLIVSWQVLEHVRDMAATLSSLQRYLIPGGMMVLEFTGKWSIPGVLGRILPRPLGRWGLIHLTNREPDSIFRAYFDRCSARELRHLLRDADGVRIVPDTLAMHTSAGSHRCDVWHGG